MAAIIKIEFEGNAKEFWQQFREEAKKGGGLPGATGGGGAPAGSKFGTEFKKGLSDSMKGFAVASLVAGGVGLGLAALNEGLDAMLAKEDALADFSSLTGVTGANLEKFGNIATQLSNDFGGSTVENIESFKGVLSRLGPEFAKSSEAVGIMGRNINVLGKASGLDATASMDALTTVMLQFGDAALSPLDAANAATEKMNIMAAAAKEGAAEIPQISEAIKQVGTTAAKLLPAERAFLDTNAAIQTLAMSGKVGSEAGIALRNVMTSIVGATGPAEAALGKMGLTSQELGKAMTERGLNDAMKNLRSGLDELESPAEKSAALVAIFGKENLAAANALIYGTEATDKFTKAITGTNAAFEQSEIKMNTASERFSRFMSIVKNIGVNILENFRDLIGDTFGQLEDAIDLISGEKEFDWMEQLKSGGKNLLDVGTLGISAWSGLDKAIGLTGETSEKAADSQKKLADATKDAAKSAKSATDEIVGGKTAKSLKDLKQEYSDLQDTLSADNQGKVTAQLKSLQKEIDKLEAPFKKTKSAAEPLKGSLAGMKKEVDELQKQLNERLVPGTAAYETALLKLTEASIKYDAVAEAQKLQLEALQFKLKDPSGWDYTQKKIAETQIAYAGLGTTLKDLQNKVKDSNSEIEDFAGPLPAIKQLDKDLSAAEARSQQFGEIAVQTFGGIGAALGAGADDAGEAWKNLLKSVGTSFISMVQGMLLASEAASAAKAVTSFGITLITDAPLIAGAYLALEGAKAYINSLDTGGVLKTDQLIMAHKDETVIPFREAPKFFAEAVNQGAGAPKATYRQPFKPQPRTTTRGAVRVYYDSFRSVQRADTLNQSSYGR